MDSHLQLPELYLQVSIVAGLDIHMLTRVTLLSFLRAFSVYANVIAIVFNTKNLHVLFTILQGQTSVFVKTILLIMNRIF